MNRYYPYKKQNAFYLKKMTMSFFTRHGYTKGETERRWICIWKLWEAENRKIWLYISRNDSERRWFIRVQFSKPDMLGGERKEFDYYIAIIAFPCHYGWLRWWFRDPCDSLQRRCSVLYLQNNWYFGSWKTLNLSYETQNERQWVWKAQTESIKAMMLLQKIKYKFRNWKYTRKMRRAWKHLNNGILSKEYTTDDVVNSLIK